jgi:hypothetical protein
MSSITIFGKTISVIPKWDGIELVADGNIFRSATLHYNITGTTDGKEAGYALGLLSDSCIMGNLYRSSVALNERTAHKLFEGVVEYEYRNTDEFTFSFETTGETQHLSQSYATIGRYAPDGIIAPDHYGAIGVNDNDIAGCDVVLPQLSFTMNRSRTGGHRSRIYPIRRRNDRTNQRNAVFRILAARNPL